MRIIEKILTINHIHINYLSFATTTIILALSKDREFFLGNKIGLMGNSMLFPPPPHLTRKHVPSLSVLRIHDNPETFRIRGFIEDRGEIC